MQKQNENFKKITPLVLSILAIGLLTYTSLRADRLSMTCDEASTFISHVPKSIFQCFNSPHCWTDANNHLLNTFLMQQTVSVFGVSEFTLRLPNLFGHLLYLIFSSLLIFRVSKNFWIALGGFCLLNLNPYLLEFFSLARGYGLGVGWMMMSIYFLFRWLDDGKWITGMYCYVGAFLAVMSNFVFLNYWASLSAIFTFFILEKTNWKKQYIYKKEFLRDFSLPFLSTIVLFFLLKNPIQYLSGKEEFDFGTESLGESFYNLIMLSVQGQGYFNPMTTNVFILLSLILLGFSIVFGFSFFYKKRKKGFSKKYFAIVGLTILILIGLEVQYYLLNIKFLDGRKATMLLPLFGGGVYLFFEFLFRGKNRKWVIGLAILISAFSWNHFYRTSNLYKSSEWNYDAETKNMVLYVNKILQKKQDAHVGVYWIFGPATEFYQSHFSDNKIKKVKRLDDQDFETLNEPDFIYLQKKDAGKISKNYILEKEFGNVGLLYRKEK